MLNNKDSHNKEKIRTNSSLQKKKYFKTQKLINSFNGVFNEFCGHLTWNHPYANTYKYSVIKY